MNSDYCKQCPFYEEIECFCNEPRGLTLVIEQPQCPIEAFPMHKIITTNCGGVYKVPDGRGKTSEYYRRPTGEWIFKSGNLILGDSILNLMWDETEKRSGKQDGLRNRQIITISDKHVSQMRNALLQRLCSRAEEIARNRTT